MSERAVVIGCGIIGVCTAYFLRRHGMHVTVLEQAAGPGRGTSYANGALLHTSLVDPWNSPGVLRQLVRSIGREDSALLLRLRALPSLLGWGVRFLRESRRERFRANTLSNAALAAHSRLVMQDLRNDTGVQYGQWFPGALLVFREDAAFEAAQQTMQSLSARGVRTRVYDSSRLCELEPALAPVAAQLAGGIHYLDDEGGDAFAFCNQLVHITEGLGVEFRFGAAVERLHAERGRVRCVAVDGDLIETDVCVVAAGSHSASLTAPLGLRLPVRPVKGYSITTPRNGSRAAPRIPVIDHALHAAIVPIGADQIRVAGTAEFDGFNTDIPQGRIENLFALLERVFPTYADEVRPLQAKAWTGLRPVSADGVPIVGRTRLANLYLNTGHGHLGWTLAAGSGQLAADLIAGVRPVIDPHPYRPDRFCA